MSKIEPDASATAADGPAKVEADTSATADDGVPAGFDFLGPIRSSLLDAGVDVVVETDGAAYAESCVCWNLDRVTKPLIITQPRSADQTATVVKAYAAAAASARAASSEGECTLPPLTVSCGRHSSQCFKDGAVVVDMGRWKEVTVDAESSTVTVFGGAKLGDMDAALHEHGLIAVTGTNPDTGVIGLSLVGGAGYASRKHGLAVDNFVRAQLVLADGSIADCSESENEDLFWAIRGGGGHVAIVTSLTMRAHKLRNTAVVEHIHFCRKKAPMTATMIGRYGEWLASAPDDVSGFCVLPCGAPVNIVLACSINDAVVPQDSLQGKKSAWFSGGMQWKDLPGLRELEGDTFGASFRIGGKSLKLMDYHKGLQPHLIPHQMPGHYYQSAFFLPEITSEVAEILADATKVNPPNSTSSVLIFPMGGKVKQVSDTATACESRQYAIWLIIEGKWKPASDPAVNAARKEKVRAWSRKLREDLAPHGIKETAHVLENDDYEGDEGVRPWESNHARLESIKARHDPTNLFSGNKRIV